MTFMEETVQRHEILYRAVKRSQPDAMDENGRPTSALFKQADGVSIDQDGGREEKIIIDAFKNRFDRRFKGLVRVGADVCIDNNMAVIPKPSVNDEYHAEIFENPDKQPLGQLKALILADNSEVVVVEPQVKWV